MRSNKRIGVSTKQSPKPVAKKAKAKQPPPRSESQYRAKPEKFKELWDRVIGVISKMRTEKVSLTQASRDSKISPRSVLRWGGPAIRKQKNGKYAAKPRDNLLRILRIPTQEGARDIALRGSPQASVLGEYWNAVHRYLETGDASQLEKFRGKHIKDADGASIPLITDTATLNLLGSAGVLSFESLYARSN